MGNKGEAEDILQEGFVTFFTKIDSYSDSGAFEGWARRIFVNTALMSLRKKEALKMSDDLETAWNVSSDMPSQVHEMGTDADGGISACGIQDDIQHVRNRGLFPR